MRDRSNRAFGHMAPFDEVFPTIDVAKISSYELGEGTNRFGMDEATYRSFGDGVPFKYGMEPCRNPLCKKGGFEIDACLDEMVRKNLTEATFEKHCLGVVGGSPKGRRKGERCGNVLHCRLTIKYKSEGLTTLV